VVSVVAAAPNEQVLDEFDNGPYQYSLLSHFFPGMFRVEVRKVNERKRKGIESAPPLERSVPLEDHEALRFSNASDQFRVLIYGYNGWLTAFKSVGFVIRNSKKMAKRLAEVVRATSMWTFRAADNPLKIEVIDHVALGLRDSDIDGISAISKSLAIECVMNNTQAGPEWQQRMIRKIRNGQMAVMSLRIITPEGLIKGNTFIVLNDQLMKGFDVRTFGPNIKGELASNGWFWVTLDPTYGVNPTKSDDMSMAIFQEVEGLVDRPTLMASLKGYLAATFEKLKNGELTREMQALANGDNNILHDEQERKFVKGRGRAGRIQLAVAEMSAAGISLTASQTLMYLVVNGLRNQFFSTKKVWDRDLQQEVLKWPVGHTWRDKDRHWFPVPYAFTTHIMTREALQAFGFKMPQHQNAFVHAATHTFVVSGDYFALHYANHGGFDLDDSIKVHVRRVRFSDGNVRLMAILVRDPVDFGEWSMTTVDEESVLEYAYHQYDDEAPIVDYRQLITKVPQFTAIRNLIQIGTLPYATNPTSIGPVYNLADEERVRLLSQAFPAGTGGTVTPKMIWYALNKTHLPALPAENEALIDVLQQGLGTSADVTVIDTWAASVFADLGNQFKWEMDAFWYHTRLPGIYRSENDGPWTCGSLEDSWWIDTHKEREAIVSDYLDAMEKWLNSQIAMPEAMSAIVFTEEETNAIGEQFDWIVGSWQEDRSTWPARFVEFLTNLDNEKGEMYTDRIIILLAHQAFVRKAGYSKWVYDQWLYGIDPSLGKLPYEWLCRAMTRVHNGTYDWVPQEYRFMDSDLVDKIRQEFLAVRDLIPEDRQQVLIDSMRGHINGLRPRSINWGNLVLQLLNEFKSS
jgi:hypothetical protein